MRISGRKLTAQVQEKNVSIEQLAQAIERTGLAQSRAISAVGNWMRGTDHPKCKREDIEAMAQALGCQMADIARFQSVFKHHKGSPRKAKLLVDLIRGKQVETALNLLTFTTKRAAVDIKKTLQAALDEANQADVNGNNLYVVESIVNNGPHSKRFQPKDRGRAHPILVRSAHITIGLEEKSAAEIAEKVKTKGNGMGKRGRAAAAAAAPAKSPRKTS